MVESTLKQRNLLKKLIELYRITTSGSGGYLPNKESLTEFIRGEESISNRSYVIGVISKKLVESLPNRKYYWKAGTPTIYTAIEVESLARKESKLAQARYRASLVADGIEEASKKSFNNPVVDIEQLKEIEVVEPVKITSVPKLSHEAIKEKVQVEEISFLWGLYKKTRWV